MSEQRAEAIYNQLIKIIEKLMGNNITTRQDELEKYGRILLKSKFMGVFASDKIPKLTKQKSYAILNLDKSYQSGSRWIAVA